MRGTAAPHRGSESRLRGFPYPENALRRARWQNGNGGYELGVVTEVHPEQAMVWFFEDNNYSIITIEGLEVLS